MNGNVLHFCRSAGLGVNTALASYQHFKKISQSVTEDEVNEKGKYEYDQPVHRHGWARAVEREQQIILVMS